MEGLLFYPRAFLHLSGSVWFCALFLLSLLIALAFRRDRKVKFLLILVILQMVIGELHQDKEARHIFPILPALFLLAGYAVAEGWGPAARDSRRVAVPVGLCGGGSAPLPRGQPRVYLDVPSHNESRERGERIHRHGGQERGSHPCPGNDGGSLPSSFPPP